MYEFGKFLISMGGGGGGEIELDVSGNEEEVFYGTIL